MACYFCQRNIKEIDYKNTKLLSKFVSGLAKSKQKKEQVFVLLTKENLPKLLKEQGF